MEEWKWSNKVTSSTKLACSVFRSKVDMPINFNHNFSNILIIIYIDWKPVYLIKDGEFSFEPGASKLLNVRVGSRFLASKLVARECKNLKSYKKNKNLQTIRWLVIIRSRLHRLLPNQNRTLPALSQNSKVNFYVQHRKNLISIIFIITKKNWISKSGIGKTEFQTESWQQLSRFKKKTKDTSLIFYFERTKTNKVEEGKIDNQITLSLVLLINMRQLGVIWCRQATVL